MAGFMSSLWGRKDTQQVSRDAIVGLRQQLQMIEKKEEYTLKKVEEELAKAKANAVTNKPGTSIQIPQDPCSRFGLGLIIILALFRCAWVCSFSRRAETEEDAGE